MSRFSIEKVPADILKELATRHKLLRMKAGFSQAELADRSGVSLGSIKRFERTGQISLESLLKLALILNRLNDFDMVFHPSEDYTAIESLFTPQNPRK